MKIFKEEEITFDNGIKRKVTICLKIGEKIRLNSILEGTPIYLGIAILNPMDTEKVIDGIPQGRLIAEGRANKRMFDSKSNVILFGGNVRYLHKNTLLTIASSIVFDIRNRPQEYIASWDKIVK